MSAEVAPRRLVASMTLAGLLLLLPPALGSEGAASYGEWLDNGRDVVLRQAWLPSVRNVHGEFRMIDRNGATCAQTLLYTPSLRRALNRIEKKERRAWSDDRPGAEDSQRYLTALDAVRDRVLGDPGAGERGEKELETLGIEFVLGDDVALFALYALEIDRNEAGVEVRAMRPLHVEAVSRDYVTRAIELMESSAFRGDDEESEP